MEDKLRTIIDESAKIPKIEDSLSKINQQINDLKVQEKNLQEVKVNKDEITETVQKLSSIDSDL